MKLLLKDKWRVLGGVGLFVGSILFSACGDEGSTQLEEQAPAEDEASSSRERSGNRAVSSAGEGREEAPPTKLSRKDGPVVDGRPAPAKPPSKYPVAVAIPGKTGFVFNPHDNNVVDARGIPPGTLIRDPQDEDENHLFRVPKIPEDGDAPAEEG